MGAEGKPEASPPRAVPSPLSPALVAGVQEVALAVAPQAAPQAQPQAAVALAGELGTPGVLTCRGSASPRSAPVLVLLYLRGENPFSMPPLTAGGAAAVPAVAVALLLGVAAVAQEAVVAGVVQLAAPMQDFSAFGGVFFLPCFP